MPCKTSHKRRDRGKHRRDTHRASKAPLIALDQEHPYYQIAMAIQPAKIGWCWRNLKLRTSPKLPHYAKQRVPINFGHAEAITRLIRWASNQRWWNRPTGPDDGEMTYAQLFLQLCHSSGGNYDETFCEQVCLLAVEGIRRHR